MDILQPELVVAKATDPDTPSLTYEFEVYGDVHPELAPRAGEKVVFKHRYSAFYNTDLETVLRCLKVEDLVISGIMTNMCCESTARDAYFRSGAFGFMLTATDGQAQGGGGIDRFRMKIWDSSDGSMVYDNQPGSPEAADPSTDISGGSIVIHQVK